MAKIKKLGGLLLNASNPSNLPIVDINASIDLYNAVPNLQNLLALQRKVKVYEFAKLSVAMAIEVNGQIAREMEPIKIACDLDHLARFVAATVNCRAGGRTLQIQGGGGDDFGEGGGYASWKEHGFEGVCALDAVHATKFEEVAQELVQKATEGALSTVLTAFLGKPSALNLEVGGLNQSFQSWVRGFRGKGICAQKSSSDGKQWVLTMLRDIPHLRPLVGKYTLELDAATRKGEQEYEAYMAEKLKRREAAAKNQLSALTMPEDWQTECFSYGDDSGNWVLQEFVRLNKSKPLPVVSKQFPLVVKAVDDYLLPQLAGKNWRTPQTPNFKTAWDNREKPNPFE